MLQIKLAMSLKKYMYAYVKPENLIEYLKNYNYFMENESKVLFSIIITSNGKFDIPISVIDIKDGKYFIGNSKEYVIENLEPFLLSFYE